MAIYFVSRSLLVGISIILILITLFLLTTWRFIKQLDIKAQLPRVALSSILIIFGAWFWLWMYMPTGVNLFWFYVIYITVLVGVLSQKLKIPDTRGTPKRFWLIFSIPLWLFLFGYMGIIVGSYLFFNQLFKNIRFPRGHPVKYFALVLIAFIVIFGVNQVLFKPIDNANYFDSLLTYPTTDLPFHTQISGDELRVVDFALASSIMSKSNTFGTNTWITDIHLGKINGSTYWIGAVSFSGSKTLRPDLNHYQGFLAVDFSDPLKTPLKIDYEFHAGTNLVINKNLWRIVNDYDLNYVVADNTYFTMNDEGDMRLMVPYSIRAPVLFGGYGAGIITQEIFEMGGVLEVDRDGIIVEDYTDLTLLPSYGKVQFYAEDWLEREIRYWGGTITDIDSREFKTMAWFGGPFKSTYLMGIDDDTRVIVNPDTNEDVQIIMLDSTGSENQLLRGAIICNATGMYFYDWHEYSFIDTNTAHEHGQTGLTNYFGNELHKYETLLPILYPVSPNPTTLLDYAYVMPLQFDDIRFGGIVITDPLDKTGGHTSVQIAEGDNVNITQLVSDGIADYLSASGIDSMRGDFNISDINSYVQDGNTVYVMEGNFTGDGIPQIITIVFTQERIADIQQWIQVVNADIGETLDVSLILENGVYYATKIN